MKKSTLLVLLLLFVGLAAGRPSFSIKQSCSSSEEPVFSMYSKKGGNIGSPGYFKWQVCVTETDHTAIRQRCQGKENAMLAMYKRNDSHASEFGEYRWNICVPEVTASLNETCSNPIASMRFRDDSHVGGPNHFRWKICPTITKRPETVTLEMTMDSDQVFVSGSQADKRIYKPLEVSFPYIVGERDDYVRGIVNYGTFQSLGYIESGDDVLNMTQEQSGSFLVPFTEGGHEIIDDHESQVIDREFLDLLGASFGFGLPEEGTVKVALQPEGRLHGFSGQERNFLDIAVRNRFDDDNVTDIVFRLK